MIPRQNQSWVSEFILLGFSRDPMTNNALFIVFLLIYLSSVLGNGLIILLICLDSQLHTPMYFFLCNLSLLDMGYVTTTIPQMLVHLLAKSQTISIAGCWLQMYMFDALELTECILFVVMAYDWYVAICYPLTELYCHPHLGLMLMVGSWYLVSLIVASYIRIAMAILKMKSTQGHCKTFSTCASHLTVVTLFYIPATYIYMRPNSSSSPEHDKQISLFYNALSALLNPMVYSLRNKDIKRAFLKMMDMVDVLLNQGDEILGDH
ncbi:Olfactory receptor 2D3 [Lemmus lemmus]